MRPGKTTQVRVIAGKTGNIKALDPAPNSGASDTNEVAIWTMTLEPGAQWRLPSASAFVNRSLYFYDGTSIQIAEKDFTSHQAIELLADQEVVLNKYNLTTSPG